MIVMHGGYYYQTSETTGAILLDWVIVAILAYRSYSLVGEGLETASIVDELLIGVGERRAERR